MPLIKGEISFFHHHSWTSFSLSKVRSLSAIRKSRKQKCSVEATRQSPMCVRIFCNAIPGFLKLRVSTYLTCNANRENLRIKPFAWARERARLLHESTPTLREIHRQSLCNRIRSLMVSRGAHTAIPQQVELQEAQRGRLDQDFRCLARKRDQNSCPGLRPELRDLVQLPVHAAYVLRILGKGLNILERRCNSLFKPTVELE